MPTKISWCDDTINPVVGCSKHSEGCKNCYAENMAQRLANMGMEQYKTVTRGEVKPGHTPFHRWNGQTAFVPSELEKPFKWKKPRSIFVSSMGDLFHLSVSIKWQIAVLNMVRGCPQHTFILLTKRPEYMYQVMTAYVKQYTEILPNLILGVSVENQLTADERIPVLLKTPAAKRFISLEPMIGKVDLINLSASSAIGTCYYQCFNPCGDRPALDAVILGGESGPGARPLHPDWVRLVRDQCAAAGVSFMFKQWGEWAPYNGSSPDVIDDPKQTKYRTMEWDNEAWKDVGYPLWCDLEDNIDAEQCTARVGRKAAGNKLDGCTHTELAWGLRSPKESL